MRARQIVFWLHLIMACVAGAAIFAMCFSGAVMAAQAPLLHWAEAALRHPTPPAPGAATLPLDAALSRAFQQEPRLRPTALVISRDPGEAVTVEAADHIDRYLNPYTGALQAEPQGGLPAFIKFTHRLHTHLDIPGAGWAADAGNVILFLLAISGLYLWWPRRWNWTNVRPALWFVRGTRGRAREWNWHNVTAIWFLPFIVILAGSGILMSYRSLRQETARLATRYLAPGVGAPKVLSTATGAHSIGDVVAAIEAGVPEWQSMRIGPASPLSAIAQASAPKLTALVQADHPRPAFNQVRIAFDPANGRIVQTDFYTAATADNRAALWIRMLHTGQAFGWPSRIIAALACLAGCFLVYTGYARALRRLFPRSRSTP